MLAVARIGKTFFQVGLQHRYGAMMSHRTLTMHTLNQNIYLCTPTPRNIEVDKKSLRLKQVRDKQKPIVLMICWFYGTKNQINKYAKLYTDKGMDVLVGQISLAQFLFSIKNVEKYSGGLMNVLANNKTDYPKIYIHSFSSASGVYGIGQRIMKRDVEKFKSIPDRVIGQVWDSIAHANKTIVAIPFAVFPQNQILQSLVRAILKIHLLAYRPLQAHYQNAMDNFYDSWIKAPALLVSSKIDPIGAPEFAEDLTNHWRSKGVDVVYKCFEDSQHIKHYQKYPDEYLKLLHAHWEKVKLLE